MTDNTNSAASKLAVLDPDGMQHLLGWRPLEPDDASVTLQHRWDRVITITRTVPDTLDKYRRRYLASYGRLRVMLDELARGNDLSRSAWRTKTSLETQRDHLARLQKQVAETEARISEGEAAMAKAAKQEEERHEMKIDVMERTVQTDRDVLDTEIERIIDEDADRRARGV